MSSRLPNLPDRHHCSGCRVCRDVCPKSAIVMNADQHGFFYPEVDEKLCIGCRTCEKACPMQNQPAAYRQVREAKTGVHKDAEVASRSSSGGAFSAVVKAWHPDAVCGVRWDGFRAVNDIAYSEEEIRAFSKSKYILSDTEEIYLRAAKEVRAGKRVLFSGTPCQVAAFRNIVGEQDNLLLVDLVCHGAPSQKLLQMHLEELAGRKGKTIKSWSFRDKTPVKGLVSSRSARVDFEDGSWQHFEIKDDAYLQLYYARLAYREACGNCIYARPERISDITVCDAHHIGELYPDLSMEKGASTILFHTEKGMGLLAGIRDSMDLKDVDYDWIVDHNQQLAEPTRIHPRTEDFYRMIDAGESFEKAVTVITHRSLLSRAVGKVKRSLRRKH